MNTNQINEIITAKNESAGAYLWLHESGDCILWPDQDSSQNDDGSRAIGRWQLTASERSELQAAGVVDELA